MWGTDCGEKLGHVLMGSAMLNKPLIQFSFDGLCSLQVVWLGPNYGKGNEDNGNLLQRICAETVVFSAPDPAAGHCWPPPPLETPGHSQASLAQSLVGTLLLFPGSWYTKGFLCAFQESVSPVLSKFWIKSHWPPKSKPWGFSVPLPDPQVGKSVMGPRTFLTVWEFLWCNYSTVHGPSAW